jgi:opacity protein-like surface antigen
VLLPECHYRHYSAKMPQFQLPFPRQNLPTLLRLLQGVPQKEIWRRFGLLKGEFIMRFLTHALIGVAAIAGLVSTASAADLAYKVKAPVMATPIYSWTGFYGGFYGGVGAGSNSSDGILADPGAGQTVIVGGAANGSAPIFSQAYNNLASGGVGQVSNTIIPGGVQCSGFTNCNPTVTPPATTSVTPNTNPGYRTDAMLPTSQGASQMSALYGFELGYRRQFDHLVVGIGADITGFTHGGSTSSSSNGSFFNSNGFTGNSQATGCITSIGAPANTCAQFQNLNVSGNVQTVNSGGSTANFSISGNPNWVGTVRASAGYAFDRVLIFGSAGFAYSDAKLAVMGSYKDTVTSACTGTSNVFSAAGTGGSTSGQAFVGYQCGAAPVNSASVSQVVSTSINYSGNHGGMLTGFAAGGGAAYAVTDHVSLMVEGVYYNLGTERTTVTGTGTQTATTTTVGSIGTANGGVTTGPNSSTTTTGPASASSFTVSHMIDGVMLKGGVQFKF